MFKCFEQVVKSSTSYKVPDCIQKSPKPLLVPSGAKPVAIAVAADGKCALDYKCHKSRNEILWLIVLVLLHDLMT